MARRNGNATRRSTLQPRSDGATPVCYAGLVTYRSTDIKNYAHTTDTNWSFFLSPSTLSYVSANTKTAITGLAFISLVDSNANGKPDNGDKVGFVALCGPYGSLRVPGINAGEPYGYSTCALGIRSTLQPTALMTPEDIFDLNLTGGCLLPLLTGNLKITPLATIARSPSSSTSLSPTSTTVDPGSTTTTGDPGSTTTSVDPASTSTTVEPASTTTDCGC